MEKPEHLEAAEVTYRYPRRLFWVGVGCSVGFLCIGVFSFASTYWNWDGSFDSFSHPKRAAFLFAGFWLVFLLIGMYFAAGAKRERLKLTADELELVSCFSTRKIRWAELAEARWRKFPTTGSIVLRTGQPRLVVEFGLYAPADRQAIVHQIRNRVPKPVQQKWEDFEQQWLMPPSQKAGGISQRFLLGVLLAVFAIVFMFIWMQGHQLHYLGLSGINLVVALFLFFLPKTKASAPPNQSPPATN